MISCSEFSKVCGYRHVVVVFVVFVVFVVVCCIYSVKCKFSEFYDKINLILKFNCDKKNLFIIYTILPRTLGHII